MGMTFQLRQAVLLERESMLTSILAHDEAHLSQAEYDRLMDELIDVQNELASIRPSQVVSFAF